MFLPIKQVANFCIYEKFLLTKMKMSVGLCSYLKALKENVFPADQSCCQNSVASG